MQSSANSLIRDVKLLLMSLMHKRNISGPKTVPCSTPDITVMNSDDSPLTTTHCMCCESQELIHPWISPWMPQCSNLVSRHWWGTVSNALEKSNSIRSTCFRWSMACWIFSINCVWQEYPGLKLCWDSWPMRLRQLYIFKYQKGITGSYSCIYMYYIYLHGQLWKTVLYSWLF